MKPKNNPKGSPDRVIVSAEEAARERVAQRLLAQGNAAFGDPNERFDLTSDKAAMDDVGMKLKEPDMNELAAKRNMELEAIATAGFGGGEKAPVTTPAPAPAPAPAAWGGNLTETKPEEASKQEANEEPQQKAPATPALSEDPVERMHQISNIFKEIHPNFPTGDQLVHMKNMMGGIFILDLDDKVFIYRSLKRQEWVQMNANEAYHSMRQDQKEDMIFNKCVAWPRLGPDQIAALPAGCISSVVSQIEQQSMFLDPRQLANVTIKL